MTWPSSCNCLGLQSQVNLYSSSPAVSRHTSYQLLAGPYILSDSTNGGHKILTFMVLSVTLFLRSLSVSYKAFEYVEWINLIHRMRTLKVKWLKKDSVTHDMWNSKEITFWKMIEWKWSMQGKREIAAAASHLNNLSFSYVTCTLIPATKSKFSFLLSSPLT